MNTISELKLLLKNPSIGDDAWADVFVLDAIKIVTEINNNKNTEELFSLLDTLEGRSRHRLIEILLDLEPEDKFSYFINLIKTSDRETVEIIFDSLRTWNLNSAQSATLIETYLPFKGQSKLLDYVMEDFIKKYNH